MQFFVREELFKAGVDDCGTDVVGPLFHVVAEDEKGNRWQHFHGFAGLVRTIVPPADEYDDSRVHFDDRREAALAEAERLLARVLAKGDIDMAYWEETYPVYGSDAYQDADALGLNVQWEKARDFA